MFTEAFITTQKNKTNFIFFCLVYQQQEHFLQGTTLVFPVVKNLPDNAAVLLSHFSHVWLFATPCTVVPQAPLSMRFSRQEYWSGLPFPSPWGLPDPGIEPRSPALQADSLPLSHQGSPLFSYCSSDFEFSLVRLSFKRSLVWTLPYKHCIAWPYKTNSLNSAQSSMDPGTYYSVLLLPSMLEELLENYWDSAPRQATLSPTAQRGLPSRS